MSNRPHSRKRGEATSSGKVERKDSGLQSNRVGNSDRGKVENTNRQPRPSEPVTRSWSNQDSSQERSAHYNQPSYSSGGPTRRRGGGSPFLRILLILLLIFFLMNFFSCGSSSPVVDQPSTPTANTTTNTTSVAGFNPPTTTYTEVNSSDVNNNAVDGVRAKYTNLKGNGNDVATVLIYMCGSDLETNYGMATADINEMAYATTGDQVNVIIETGGSRQWRNSVMSNRTNQRWQLKDGRLIVLNNNVGSRNMTDPATLTDFIRFGAANFPADRYMLILWDHGGGSVSGYGHDELYRGTTMNVANISKALRDGGIQFDFVGFDACLMANAETAVAVEPYADYLIASEETEPGTGWYYTNWLTTLGNNPSIPTVDLAKVMIDDFIIESARASSRDKTSLSIVDLAEFDHTVPTALKNFATQITDNINNNNFKPVAEARSVTKEFAQATKIDQIDIVHFCQNINTVEASQLAQAIESCVKYNRTNNMNNAYGMSIYFPYHSTRAVTTMTGIYEAIGMEPTYTTAVRSFATLESSGQLVTGSSTYSLFDLLGGSNSYYGSGSSSTISSEDILNLLLGNTTAPQQTQSYGNSLSDLLGGSGGVQSDALELFSLLLGGRAMFDTSELQLSTVNGHTVLELSPSQWELIHQIEQSVWVDDGSGYIDMGLDNVFDFDEAGNLLVEYDGNWMSINDEPVAYYFTSDEYIDDNHYRTTGYVPCLINDQKASLLIEFTPEHPDGIVYGVQNEYEDGMNARIYQPEEGDIITFIADYYNYNQVFDDVYPISDGFAYDGNLEVGVFHIAGQQTLYGYRLTDLYDTHLWTPIQSME